MEILLNKDAAMLNKKMDFLLKVVSGLIILFFGQIAFAGNYEPVENIKNTAKTFILKNMKQEEGQVINIKITQTDLPSRLSMCSKPIEASLPADSNSKQISSVELTCNGDRTWHIFVPVEVQVLENVIVAQHAITMNEVIKDEDLDFAQHDVTHLYNGYFKNKNEIVGQVAAQTLVSGAVISKQNIHLAKIVHRDEVIDLVAKTNTVVVTMKGVAKSDGALHDTIKAYNPSSKRTLDAVVIGQNQAEVI